MHCSRYLAEITYFDLQVGEDMVLLNEYQLADNTLIIATTEQGSSFPYCNNELVRCWNTNCSHRMQ